MEMEMDLEEEDDAPPSRPPASAMVPTANDNIKIKCVVPPSHIDPLDCCGSQRLCLLAPHF